MSQPSDFFEPILYRCQSRSPKWLPQVGTGRSIVIAGTEFDMQNRHVVCVAHEDPATAVYRLIRDAADTFEAYKAWHLDIPHSAHARIRKRALLVQAYTELCDGKI